MNIISIVVTVLLLVGFYHVFGLNTKAIYTDFEKLQKNSAEVYQKHRDKKKLSLKKQIDIVLDKKKKNFLIQSFLNTQSILKYSNSKITMTMVYFSSCILALVGIAISILCKNMFLLIPLPIGFALIPTWIVKIRNISIQKELNANLETAISGITTSYMSGHNFVKAVEENLKYIDFSIQEPFSTLVYENRYVDPNVSKSIRNLKGKINSSIFHEWCDVVIRCQSDAKLIPTLFPILSKFSELKNIQSELDTTMMVPLQEFFILSGLVVFSIPMMYFLNKDWFYALINTTGGNIVIAFAMCSIFIAGDRTVSICKPLEYKQ